MTGTLGALWGIPTRMFVPERAFPILVDGTCAGCKREPGHRDMIAAQGLGYEWESVEPMPGIVGPFMRCPDCSHQAAHAGRQVAIDAGYSDQAVLTCCGPEGAEQVEAPSGFEPE